MSAIWRGSGAWLVVQNINGNNRGLIDAINVQRETGWGHELHLLPGAERRKVNHVPLCLASLKSITHM